MIYAAIAFVVFFISVLLTYYILKRRKKYTRERYIFFASIMVFSFASLVLTHLVNDNSLIITVIKLFNLLPIENIDVPTTDWTGKLLSILVLVILIIFVLFIFNDWSGATSQIDNEFYSKRQRYPILDALLRGANPTTIIIEERKTSSKKETIEETDFLDENKDWHTEVKELLRLKSKQFVISTSDWHSLEQLYVSKYSNQDIAIFCPIKYPSNEDVQQRINYLKATFKEKNFLKLLVIVKNSKELDKELPVDNVLVEYRSHDVLLNSLVDFREYFDFIQEQYNIKEITHGDRLSLKDTYVKPTGKLIYDDSNDKVIHDLESYIINWTLNDKIKNHISLLGEYGQGKSVLSLKVAYELIQRKEQRIPIIIELRGKSPKNESMLSIIASWSSQFDISAKAIEKLFHAGKLLIILEGFDEMDLIGDSHTRHLHFKRLLEFMRYEKSKVIITGRPNLFLDTQEMEKFLQFNQNNNQVFYSEPIHIEPLNKTQINHALRNTKKSIRDNILEVIHDRENKSFLDLISRPSTLYQASIIWDNLDKNNITSSSVINEFIKHSYRRQESKLRTIGKTGVSPTLTINEREYFMIGVAVGMIQEGGYSNQINKIDLEIIIRQLYYEIPEEISSDDVSNNPLRKRLENNSHAIESVFNDVRTSGILVKDLSGNDSFKFAHKSFLEFLFALFFVHKVTQKNSDYSLIVNTISNALSIKDIYNFHYTKEVISFISSYLINILKQEDFIVTLFMKVLPSKLLRKTIKIANYNLKSIITMPAYIGGIILILDFFKEYFFPISYMYESLNFTDDTINVVSVTLLCVSILGFMMGLVLSYVRIKIRKPLLIWYKTCKVNYKEEEISEVIKQDIIEELTQESEPIKAINLLFGTLTIKKRL